MAGWSNPSNPRARIPADPSRSHIKTQIQRSRNREQRGTRTPSIAYHCLGGGLGYKITNILNLNLTSKLSKPRPAVGCAPMRAAHRVSGVHARRVVDIILHSPRISPILANECITCPLADINVQHSLPSINCSTSFLIVPRQAGRYPERAAPP